MIWISATPFDFDHTGRRFVNTIYGIPRTIKPTWWGPQKPQSYINAPKVWIHVSVSLTSLVTFILDSLIRQYWETGWWFGTFGLFFHILGIIIPTDFHIFQRGRYTTNQEPVDSPQIFGVPLADSQWWQPSDLHPIAAIVARSHRWSRCNWQPFNSFGTAEAAAGGGTWAVGLLWSDHMGYDWRIFGRIWGHVSLDIRVENMDKNADAAIPS